MTDTAPGRLTVPKTMNSPKLVRAVAKRIIRATASDGSNGPAANLDAEDLVAVAEEIANLVRAEIAAELKSLAEFRNEYGGPGPHEDAIAREVHTARLLSRIIGRKHDALGWLPSWKVPAYTKRHNPNGSEVFER